MLLTLFSSFFYIQSPRRSSASRKARPTPRRRDRDPRVTGGNPQITSPYPQKLLFAPFDKTGLHVDHSVHDQLNHAVRSERWRYIRYNDGSEELYDHEADPNEWHNIAGDAKYTSVMEAHRKWLPKVNAPECEGTEGSGWEASEYAQGRRELVRE